MLSLRIQEGFSTDLEKRGPAVIQWTEIYVSGFSIARGWHAGADKNKRSDQMSYFSRLTDIVTCDLTQLLAQAEDPKVAILEIVREMREGVAGAQRSVNTASASEKQLRLEIETHQAQVELWTTRAIDQIQGGSETEARQSLLRKREVEHLIAGLDQQHKAAVITEKHLSTMQLALEARLSDALRRQETLGVTPQSPSVPHYLDARPAAKNGIHREIDEEIERLKRNLK